MNAAPLDPSWQIPQHVAIVMDGNGRWAQKRGLPRTAGHKQGAETVRTVVEAAADVGVKYLTLFGFSTENWRRPQEEVSELLRLMRFYLQKDLAELHENGIRVSMIGDRSRLEEDMLELIKNAETMTAGNDKLCLTIAFSYGGRSEIVEAARRAAAAGGEITEASFADHLMTAGLPDVDLFIRTSGEKRISNFLLWQIAYAEMVFTDTYWPDFNRTDLVRAIEEFNQRERRFGGLSRSVAR